MPTAFGVATLHDAFAFETLAVTTSGIRPTTATWTNTTVPKIAQYALFTVEGTQIRWRVDGTAPSTSVGHLNTSGDVIEIRGSNNIAHVQFVATSSSGNIQVTYAM